MKKLHWSQPTIYNRLVKYGIPLRSVGPVIKYPKIPFSGDPMEKAYILGLRTSDVHFCKNGNQIAVQIFTTVPSMIELFKKVFGKYGHVVKFPNCHRKRPIFQWGLCVYLHKESFECFLKKPKTIPDEIKDDKKLFMQFLAAYDDGEGTLGIYPRKDGKYFHCDIRIASEDVGILKDAKEKLTEHGYHPSLFLKNERGFLTSFGPLSNDL